MTGEHVYNHNAFDFNSHHNNNVGSLKAKPIICIYKIVHADCIIFLKIDFLLASLVKLKQSSSRQKLN